MNPLHPNQQTNARPTTPIRWARRCVSAAAVGLAIACMGPSAAWAQAVPNAAADESLTEKARELFAEGNAYSAEGDFVRARASLKAAWGLMHHWGIAANLGEVEVELGNHRDAAEMLAFALRSWPEENWDKERAAVRATFEKARARVGTVEVTVDVEGATVLVDGEPAGQAPLPDKVFVEPGRRVLSAKAPGLGRADAEVFVQAGETAAITLRVQETDTPRESEPPAGGPGEGNADPVDGGDASSPGAKGYVVIAGVGLTLAAAATAGVFKLRANAAQSDADETGKRAFEELGFRCPNADISPLCEEQASALDRRNSSNAIATGAMVGAGVLGAATVAAWLLWPDDAAKVDAAASRDFIGLRVQGRF